MSPKQQQFTNFRLLVFSHHIVFSFPCVTRSERALMCFTLVLHSRASPTLCFPWVKYIEHAIYNYPLKGRWIMVGVYTKTQKRRGMYLVLWTNPKGDSCFSTYHIIWIQIKKELFVNKRHHLVRVCLRFNWRCFRDHLLRFVANAVRKFFSIDQ